MCCPLLLIAFFGPRTALIYLWLVGYLNGAYETVLWPLLGFFCMPFTTLAYAVAMHNGGVKDFSAVMVIVAVLIDLGIIGGAERERRGRRRTE